MRRLVRRWLNPGGTARFRICTRVCQVLSMSILLINKGDAQVPDASMTWVGGAHRACGMDAFGLRVIDIKGHEISYHMRNSHPISRAFTGTWCSGVGLIVHLLI